MLGAPTSFETSRPLDLVRPPIVRLTGYLFGVPTSRETSRRLVRCPHQSSDQQTTCSVCPPIVPADDLACCAHQLSRPYRCCCYFSSSPLLLDAFLLLRLFSFVCLLFSSLFSAILIARVLDCRYVSLYLLLSVHFLSRSRSSCPSFLSFMFVSF